MVVRVEDMAGAGLRTFCGRIDLPRLPVVRACALTWRKFPDLAANVVTLRRHPLALLSAGRSVRCAGLRQSIYRWSGPGLDPLAQREHGRLHDRTLPVQSVSAGRRDIGGIALGPAPDERATCRATLQRELPRCSLAKPIVRCASREARNCRNGRFQSANPARI